MFSNLRLSTKLITSFLLVGLIPFIVIAWIAVSVAKEGLINARFDQLRSLREIKAQQIEDNFEVIRNQAKTLSNSTMIVDAMREFRAAFPLYRIETGVGNIESMRTELYQYYENEFNVEYRSKNNGHSAPALSDKYRMLDADSVALQHAYIFANSNPLGSKHLLDRSADSSEYSRVHQRYHPAIRHYLETFGYYDIFLVDPDSGDILYSVFKELDYTTSLIDGPYAGTNFARAFQMANSASDADYVGLVDLEPYFPSYEYPAGFVASPIFDGSTKVGVLIMQIPVEQIDAIMTSRQQWQEIGLGESGETYIVGKDFAMRSNSRFLLEAPDEYFEMITSLGMDPSTIEVIRAKETSALNQEVQTPGTVAATAGQSGEDIFEDYRGVRVASSYKPLSIPGLSWVLMSELDEEEVLLAVGDLTFIVWCLLIAGVLLIAGFGIFVSRSVAVPLARVTTSLDDAAKRVNSAAGNVRRASTELADGASSSAASIEETAASIEQLSSMVEQNAENAKQARRLSNESAEVAVKGDTEIKSLMQAMSELSEDSKKIEEIIKVIDDIAFQTNLLALNAAVEAARAGEQGKGFAVVAEAVRSLAQQSADAAQDITGLIKTSVQKIERSTSVADQSGVVLNEIVNQVTEVNQLVNDIAGANEEQANGIGQIRMAITELDGTTQKNARSSDEGARASELLLEQADSMERFVRDLTSIIGQLEDAKREAGGAANWSAASPHKAHGGVEKAHSAPLVDLGESGTSSHMTH